MDKVSFAYLDTQFSFSTKTNLKKHVATIFKNEQCNFESLQYIFCTDAYLLQINQQFLDHDTYTDIVTFALHEKHQDIQGEIYISIDRVKENASTYNTSFKHELLRVVSHGALHLCGYKDKTKTQQLEMRAKEDFYINHYLTNYK